MKKKKKWDEELSISLVPFRFFRISVRLRLLSTNEWNNIKTKEFQLFTLEYTFTDDTVMTLSVAEGLMNGGNAVAFIKAMQKYGRIFPYAGYEGRFGSWIFSDDAQLYNSWGNGTAMRISPVAWISIPSRR